MRIRLVTLLALVALVAGAAPSHAATIGVTAFGGRSISVVQDDNGSGTLLGVRVPVGLISAITIEPFFSKASYDSSKAQDFNGVLYRRSGFDRKTYGVNLVLGSPAAGAGLKFFPYAGISTNKLTRIGSDDLSSTGYDFGLGLGAGLTNYLSLVARGEVDIVKDADATRKFANVTVGLSYTLLRNAPASR